MDRGELRGWIEDALARHDRDARERDEVNDPPTRAEILDSVWGRLPVDVRRRTSRAEAEASLMLLIVRRAIALRRDEPRPDPPALGQR
jgi:hypothetical protein